MRIQYNNRWEPTRDLTLNIAKGETKGGQKGGLGVHATQFIYNQSKEKYKDPKGSENPSTLFRAFYEKKKRVKNYESKYLPICNPNQYNRIEYWLTNNKLTFAFIFETKISRETIGTASAVGIIARSTNTHVSPGTSLWYLKISMMSIKININIKIVYQNSRHNPEQNLSPYRTRNDSIWVPSGTPKPRVGNGVAWPCRALGVCRAISTYRRTVCKRDEHLVVRTETVWMGSGTRLTGVGSRLAGGTFWGSLRIRIIIDWNTVREREGLRRVRISIEGLVLTLTRIATCPTLECLMEA